MTEFRSSWYWEEYDDDDLNNLAEGHLRLINNSKYELGRIHEELRSREAYDAEHNC